MVKRFEVYLTDLEPTIGVELLKKRPCLIISPDELNLLVRTVIIAPMTTKSRNFPSRVACEFERKSGFIVLDQIRSVDKLRLGKYLGKIDGATQDNVLERLVELFSK